MLQCKKVVNGNVIIFDDTKQEKVTSTGIVIPQQLEGKVASEAVVVAFDETDEKIRDMGLKTGDRILYSKFAGEDLEVKDQNGQLLPFHKSIHVDSLVAFL